MNKKPPHSITQLTHDTQNTLLKTVCEKFDKLDQARAAQLTDITHLRTAIYEKPTQNVTSATTGEFALPDLWELAQTLKSHLSENLFTNPESMFDVVGENFSAQADANTQKAMLVNYFERMKLSDELEKIIDSVVETGEATVLVGWHCDHKLVRRPQTMEEQIFTPTDDGFVVEKQKTFDGPKVKFIPAQDFVFDPERVNNFESAAKIYRTYCTPAEIADNEQNNLLNQQKMLDLQNLTQNVNPPTDLLAPPSKKGVKGELLELLEFWGDITIDNVHYANMLVVVAGRTHIVRLEQNPFIAQPFVHASVITDPRTARGVSPLKVALGLSDIASVILNKQLDALSLVTNPPYLAPKGCFTGEQVVTPGKIIEYDAALMPNQPIPLNFSPALKGWDFINFFKTSIESATGIYKTMAGNLPTVGRTATEVNYSASGQSARLNMILDAISRKILVPIVEKTAQTLANFKMGDDPIFFMRDAVPCSVVANDAIRHNSYVYHYGDRKATLERKYRFKELFDVVAQFAQNSLFAENIDYVECFKFALEQYGIENPTAFLVEKAPLAPTSDETASSQPVT